jgi:phosphate starvation-inducible PhoH-like protein
VARKVVVEADDLTTLFGANDENLRSMEEILGVRASARGNEVRLEGGPEQVARAENVLAQLAQLQAEVPPLKPQEVRAACRLVAENPDYRLRSFFVESTVRVTPQRAVSPKSFNQKVYVETIRARDIVFGIGPAGTGKTYLAIAMAVQALAERSKKRIILARPAVEAGEKLGFLPGDLYEKVHPYLRPLYDALHDMLDAEVVARYIAKGIIEVAPIAFMRGRTLNDSFVILDEAQNTTSEQMKMFLTRIGFNSKAVITGDVTQVDLPPGKVSGLKEARKVIADVAGIGFVYFDERDVVRHPLVQSIIRAYERHAARDGSEG